MKAARFDRWTRLFAVRSRRHALRSLASVALAAAFGRTLAPEAAARICRLLGEDCDATLPCCTFGDPDIYNLRCQQGACRCQKGFGNCDGGQSCERNLRTDAEHCGACGNGCKDSFVCRNGACQCERNGNCRGCLCVKRKEGGRACAGSGPFGRRCQKDADCRFRSFCAANGRCTDRCSPK